MHNSNNNKRLSMKSNGSIVHDSSDNGDNNDQDSEDSGPLSGASCLAP